MSLLLALLLTASPDARVIVDPGGFQFTVPAGFDAFPGFTPTEKKLYAFGKNLGTPDAITLTIDLVDAPVKAGNVSASCGALMNSIDRTVGKPTQEKWRGTELIGLRMLMTHVFGEVLVFCVDVPGAPKGLSLMVSGKVGNEAALREVFVAVLSSIDEPSSGGGAARFLPHVVIGVVLLVLGFLRLRRRSAR